MKYIITFLFASLSLGIGLAQPTNDNCNTALDLGTAPVCEPTVYTNVGATTTTATPPASCFNAGISPRDVFFSFQVTADMPSVNIIITGVTTGPNGVALTNPQVALYRGNCTVGLAELYCETSLNGETVISLATPDALTPGVPYFLRINDWTGGGGNNAGDFTICIEEYVAPLTMGSTTFSEACSGTLYDSGGPDANYGDSEDNFITICPDQEHSCIIFDLLAFDMENGFDELSFFAGDSPNAPLITTISGTGNGSDFTILAASECVTITFTSDGSVNRSGFELTWLCSAAACGGSTADNPTVIPQIPYTNTTASTCGAGATFAASPCGNTPFLNGPEMVFLYNSPGDICAEIQITNAQPGTGVLVLDGPPNLSTTNCVASSPTGTVLANFEEAGDYYIVVADGDGCTDFDISITEGPCILNPSLVNALCNPLNGCVDPASLTTTLSFQDGFEDIPLTGANDGCWLGNGAQPDYTWFTIEAQADGPFGFILQSANNPSDIDINVWGPFSIAEVCDTPNDVIDFISNNEPVRSTWTGGTQPTGLADIHPITGIQVTDDYDCGSPATPGAGGDAIVRTIPAQQGEVFVVLANDFGNVIEGGTILIDWSPSEQEVLGPLGSTVEAADTSVCLGEPVQLRVTTGIDNITWISDNAVELSCTDCFDPIAQPTASTVYKAVLEGVCYNDTINVAVNVFNLEAGGPFSVCIGESFDVPAGQDFNTAAYEWFPPANGLTFSCTDCPTPTVTSTAAGIYMVPVTLTAEACDFQDTVMITVLPAPAPTVTISDDLTICEGESAQIGGPIIAGQTYNWVSSPLTPGGIPGVPNPTVTPTVTTTYYIEVQNGLCPVSSTDSVTVTVIPLPEISIVPDAATGSVCRGDTLHLQNSIFESDVTYAWTGPNMIMNPDSVFTVISPDFTGVYRLTGDRQGCITEDAIAVEVIPVGINLAQPDTLRICEGASINIDAIVTPNNLTVNWNQPGVNGASPVLTPGSTTFYTATVQNQQCVRVDTLVVLVDDLPEDMSIMAEPDKDEYCQGELIQLLSPIFEPGDYPEIMHTWVGPGQETPDSLYNLVFTAIETFTYVRTTVNGVCSQVDSIEIVVINNDALMITPQNPVICPGESVQLTVSSATLGDLEWMPAETLSCDDCATPVASPGSTTQYNVTSEISGCEVSASVTVIVGDVPEVALINDQLVCPGTALTLNAAGAQPGVTYTWTSPTDPNFSSSSAAPQVVVNQSQTYNLVAANACDTIQGTVQINVVQPGVILDIPESVTACAGQPFELAANVQQSPGASNTLVWQYDGQSNLGATTTFNAGQSGTATFAYSYGPQEGNFCETIIREVAVNVVPFPIIDVIDDLTICPSDVDFVILNNAPAEPGTIYAWTSNPAGFTSDEAAPEASPDVSTTYTLTATLGECVATDEVTVTVTPPNTLDAGEDITVTLNGQNPTNVNVAATLANPDPSGTYTWIFADQVQNGANATFSVTPTNAPGVAIVTFSNACETLVDSLNIGILAVQIPNVFTPNNDNLNDVFKPYLATAVDELEVVVYNRWGQKVFESTDANNPGWDGQVNGKPAPSDLYIYRVRFGSNGVFIEENGSVTLMR